MSADNGKPSLNQDMLVEVRGKKVPSYAGVLDLAHQHGLVSIRTSLIQAPTEENGREAIVHATITLLDAAGDMPQRIFEALGDANPNNVNRPIAAHIIRMAETRAKGRAMRDATNIGLAIAEELGEDHAEPPMARPSQTRPASAAKPIQSERAADDGPEAETLTEKQRRTIWAIAKTLGAPQAADAFKSWLTEVVGFHIDSLSTMKATTADLVIEALRARERAAQPTGQTERAGTQPPRGRP